MLGLSDFKNYKQVNLTNFVNFIFTKYLVSKLLLRSYRSYYQSPNMSLADLKTIFNARLRAEKMIKYLGIQDDNYFYFNQIQLFVPDDIINRS